ncbi:iron ABC transporter permease [Terrarubrum flagellatum]|uniref:ABC transporter permease n=1 Tax=Terrirubrum flagellatum TaxID=2895980 RepID=UPI003145000B
MEAAASYALARLRGAGQERFLAVAMSALLAVMVIAPLATVIMGAVGDEDGFSLDALTNVLRSARVIGNTLLVSVGATTLATMLGGALALILVRTDTPLRASLEQLVLLPLYVTPLLTAIAWSWLGSPHGGLINLFLQNGLGLPGPLVNLQSAAGVIFVSALAYAPLPFLLIAGALRGMDPSLEDSARIHGASIHKAFAMVTLPLMLPALLGSALLVFVQSLGLFSVPAVLGMPAGFYVAATEIYRLLNSYPPRVTQAAGWGLLLLVVTAALVAIQAAILRRRSYVTISGKAFRPQIVSVGRWRVVLLAFVALYLLAAVALPIATLCWAALVNFITIDPKLMAFDLRHFNYVLFVYPKTLLASRNSALLGVLTATVICALGLCMAWVTVRSRSFAARFLDQVGMMPLAIPPIVLALGLLWTYVGVSWLPIYGTIGILLLAYATHYLPFGLRALSSAIRQLHPELEDAARVSGASLFGTLRRIVLPLTRPTLFATWTLLFILSLQEISSSILLYTAPSTVLSVAVFDLWEAGNVNALAALSVMQLFITFIALVLVARFRQKAVAA